MKTFTVEIDGLPMVVQQDDDGAFIVPDGWRGVGTALKPATEIIVLARKPLGKSTVAANVQAFGCGALNIDGCRIGTEATITKRPVAIGHDKVFGKFNGGEDSTNIGRWPANVLHDGSEEVLRAFPESESKASNRGEHADIRGDNYNRSNGVRLAGSDSVRGHTDSGSAARFFYTSKADAADRLGSKHPTVKPVDLIAYLCRLICPPGGTILDPFAGSGTLAFAAMREGFNAILIEKEAEYVADIRRRIAHVSGQDAPLFAGAL